MTSVKEPLGLVRTDGKIPDGVTKTHWYQGKCATWDVTVTDTLAASNLASSQLAAGNAAEAAASRKQNKYSQLMTYYIFVPVAFETRGPVNVNGA